tara:strand:+ start:121 stop:246 length:126 start_codon:yes stop_codon:yes gene_type:complete
MPLPGVEQLLWEVISVNVKTVERKNTSITVVEIDTAQNVKQ